MKPILRSMVSVLLSTLLVLPVPAAPVTTAFSYQGRLAVSGAPASGSYDLQFQLYDALTSGGPVGSLVSVPAIEVTNGVFTVTLDFGAGAFNGQQRWLEIRVQPVGGGGYSTLTPRQEMTATPNALYAVTAATINGLACSDGDVPKWSGGAWICALDSAGTGTVTSIASGTGLTGGPITTSGTLAVNLGGSGAATTVSRTDHDHLAQTWTGTGVGLTVNTSGVLGLNARATSTTGDNIGVKGQSDSTSGAGVYGVATATTGFGYGVQGVASSSDSRGVYGTNSATTGVAYGVFGLSASSNGIGVSGLVSQSTGSSTGVLGSSASSSGRGVNGSATATSGTATGVRGLANSTTGRGVWGTATATAGVAYGVYGESASFDGTGVRGVATDTTGSGVGTGVAGVSATPGGRGVYGLASNTSSFNTGVWGESPSVSGRGVYGLMSATTGDTIGVWGQTASSSGGKGAYGLATASTGTSVGVEGTSVATSGASHGVVGYTSSPSGYGVYGLNGSTGGYAGYFQGAVNVTGALTKGSGSFKIDHPLDPENKYLYHSFVESPEMKNIYDGLATTNEHGYATVALPEWFEALNRDFRYQLTVIDEQDAEGFVLAKVVRGLADNRFVIKTSAPRAAVSWLVTGIRKDAYAKAHPIPVEEEKPEGERGSYLHPEAFGLPRERGAAFKRDPRPVFTWGVALPKTRETGSN